MKEKSYFDTIHALRMELIDEINKLVEGCDKAVILDDNIVMSCGEEPFCTTLVKAKICDDMVTLFDDEGYDFTLGDVHSVDDLANLLSSIVWATSTTNKDK